MASCRPKTEVPVITVRVLVIAHVCLVVFIGLMAWLDWSLPN
ncbi:hypothetical protein [Acetobacter sp.]|jgi:hypothetical protein|nr:hypothetical protein [Acetobacter sp.]